VKRVLVAEDDAATRSFLIAALTDEGYLVSAAADGKAALDRCAEVKPDLVLLDLSMPIVDGFEFLRRRGPDCSAPVIAVSAGFRRDQLRGLAVVAFVAKPFDLHVWTAVIARSLSSTPEAEASTKPLN
jgi:two-component system OmpR family response regulator